MQYAYKSKSKKALRTNVRKVQGEPRVVSVCRSHKLHWTMYNKCEWNCIPFEMAKNQLENYLFFLFFIQRYFDFMHSFTFIWYYAFCIFIYFFFSIWLYDVLVLVFFSFGFVLFYLYGTNIGSIIYCLQ